MLKNYLKIIIRRIESNRTFSFINIAGLSIGMACCLLIFLYVRDEVSYDKFQSKYDRIYRIIYHATAGYDLAQVPPPIKERLEEVNPEVEASARIFSRNVSVKIENETDEPKFFEETQVLFADSALKKIFDFEVLKGSFEQVLEKPYSVAITDEIAEKYFGDIDVVGKSIQLSGSNEFEVVAVVKKYPSQSHIHFNLLIPYDNMYDIETEALREVMRQNLASNWIISHSATYVLLYPGADPQSVNNRFDQMINSFAPEQLRLGQKFDLQPLSKIHLYSADISLNPENQGDIENVITFSVIGFIILLIACFNFINLSTAQSMNRAREVGVRKVLGAGKSRLFIQFMGESAAVTFIAFVLAILFVIIALPYLNILTQKELETLALLNPVVILIFLGVYTITTFLGGSFPALIISRLNLQDILKGKINTTEKRFSLRKVLIVFQMAMSVILICGAFLIIKQIKFMINRPMGFQTEAMVSIPLFSRNLNSVFGGVDSTMRSRLNAFENKMLSYPDIEAVTLSNIVPGLDLVMRGFDYEAKPEEDVVFIASFSVDYDFVQTFGLNLIAGRNFNTEAGSDHLESFIVNRKAVEEYKWGTPEDALGLPVTLEGKEGTIIGVVEDFHYTGMQREINPILIDIGVPMFSTSTVRINSENPNETLSKIEKEWNTFFPEKSFEYTWIDEGIRNSYQAERRLSRIITIFSILAIFVSSLGAYGLIMFMSNKREKEIGIRKALGASPSRIVAMMFREFTILFMIGALIAVPVIYRFGLKWLDDFNYHISLSPVIFLVGMIITILIVWVTISFHSIRSATKNPATCLRSD